MKALYQSTWYRFVLLLTLAALLAASAAVPVGATTGEANAAFLRIETGDILRINENSTVSNIDGPTQYKYLGIRTPLPFASNNTYVVVVSLYFNSYSPDNIFTTDTLGAGFTTDTWYSQGQVNNGNLNDSISARITYQSQNRVDYTFTFNTSDIQNASLFQYFWIVNFTSTDYKVSYSYINTTAHYTYDPTQTELEQINQRLDTIIDNQTSNNDEINVALNQIITNQQIELNNWHTIINYGSEYNQIDQTTINNFGTAQDNLSSAEGALQDKSQSLRDGVSSQWQNNINTTKNFVSTITPATTAITSTITQIVAVMPEEVQALLVVIPLLLFIGWLIGRIEGG